MSISQSSDYSTELDSVSRSAVSFQGRNFDFMSSSRHPRETMLTLSKAESDEIILPTFRSLITTTEMQSVNPNLLVLSPSFPNKDTQDPWHEFSLSFEPLPFHYRALCKSSMLLFQRRMCALVILGREPDDGVHHCN